MQFEATLDQYSNRIASHLKQKLRFEELKITEYQHQLRQIFHMAIKNKEYRLESIRKRLASSARLSLLNMQNQMESLETRLSLLDPKNILERGYTISSINNKLLSKFDKIEEGDELKTYTNKLIIKSRIEKSESR